MGEWVLVWIVAIVAITIVKSAWQKKRDEAEQKDLRADGATDRGSTPATAQGAAREAVAAAQAESEDSHWIRDICCRYESKKFFLGGEYYCHPDIPPKRQSQALSSFPLPGRQEAIALLDTGDWTSKVGILIGSDGISWRSFLWGSPKQMTWGQLVLTPLRREMGNLCIGENKMPVPGAAKMILSLLTTACEEYRAQDAPMSEPGHGGWIREICAVKESKDSGIPRFYFGDAVPSDKRFVALSSYPLPGRPDVLALVDTTLFGSAKSGLLIGPDGISWRNQFEDAKSLTWSQLADRSLRREERGLSIGGDSLVLGNDELMTLLVKARKRFKTLSEQASRETRADQEPEEFEGRATPPYSPTIDVNLASQEELLALPGIGIAEAKLILRHRATQGDIENLDEMASLLSMKPHTVDRLRECVCFRSQTDDHSAPQSESGAKPNHVRRQPGRVID